MFLKYETLLNILANCVSEPALTFTLKNEGYSSMARQNTGLEFYSQKRLAFSFVVPILITGSLSGYLFADGSTFVLSCLVGVIVGQLIHMTFVPKVWLYRLRQVLLYTKKCVRTK